MFINSVDQDPLEYQAIVRRRRLEEERKQRIFNPRQRCIGIDVDALDNQCNLKNQQTQQEKLDDQIYANVLSTNDKLLEKTHQATRSFRAKVDTDIGNFNISQKPEDRREFDLNNPKRLWIDLPGRINDSDPRCGASSLQKFSGEDLQREERLRDQKMQMKVWTALAKQDAINRRLQQQHEKDLEGLWWRKVDEKAQSLKEEEDSKRRENIKQLSDYNKTKAEEIKGQKPDKTEQLTSLLVPALADISLDRPHIWKFYSDQKRAQILSEEAEAKKELQMRRERNQEQEKQWFEHQKKLSSTAEQAHQDKLNLEREKLRSAARVNEWKSKEDKAREYYLNNVLYTNQPSQEYFNQFNTTSR